MTRRVAVTGGSGQLGTQVLRRLIDDREVERILDLDRLPPLLVSGKLEYRESDIRDRDGLREAFKGCDAVFHLAFAVTSKLPPEVFDAINVGGSENVFRAAAAADVSQIVYCSSTAAYGVVTDLGHTIDESTPLRCQEDFPYAKAKYRVEKFLDDFERENPQVRIARLRPPVLFGRDFGNPLGKTLARSLALGWLPLSGDDPLNVVWDQDVADAALLALRRQARGAFNLCAEEPLAPAELARVLGLRRQRIPKPLLWLSMAVMSGLARLGLTEAVDPAWSRQGGVAMTFSSARARSELGWEPSCPTVADVFRRYLEVAPGRDRRVASFFRFLDRAARLGPPRPGASGTLGPVHLCLTGPGGGDFILIAEDGRLRIREGVPRPPKSAATLSVALWRDLVLGKTRFPTAQMTGKVRLEGDPSAGFLVPGILTRIRQESSAKGFAGRLMRSQIRRLTKGEAR